MNSIARSSEVQWMVVGMNMPCLESQSTITRIELQLEDVGRVSMKSIEMDVQGSEVASVNCKVYASGVWLAYKLYKIYNISWQIHRVRARYNCTDEVHCLILTRMSREDVVMLVAENSEPEVIGIGDIYETIVAEKSIGSDWPVGLQFFEVGNVKRIVGKCGKDIRDELFLIMITIAWRTGFRSSIAQSETEICSWVNIGWKLLGLMVA